MTVEKLIEKLKELPPEAKTAPVATETGQIVEYVDFHAEDGGYVLLQ